MQSLNPWQEPKDWDWYGDWRIFNSPRERKSFVAEDNPTAFRSFRVIELGVATV
jgi:hypothetical protein